MHAVILNSGIGSRLFRYTEHNPKCMVELAGGETILSRQLKLLKEAGVLDVIISTGYMQDKLKAYTEGLDLDLNYTWVYNADYLTTNYIVSLDKVAMVRDDILLMHGDLVFTNTILNQLLQRDVSGVIIDKSQKLPEKDFKAKIKNGKADKIGIDYFGKDCVALQPLYYLKKEDWMMWKQAIRNFCEQGKTGVYAEEAYNAETRLQIAPVPIAEGGICMEVDNEEDLKLARRMLKEESVDGCGRVC